MRLSLAYHLIQGLKYNVPAEHLRTALEACCLDVEIKDGGFLKKDPELEREGYAGLIERWRSLHDRTGHIVFTTRYIHHDGEPDFPEGTRGRLIDVASRGVCAVYVGSGELAQSELEGVLQSALHEIGHMLNLGHGHAKPTYSAHRYSNAMQIAKKRRKTQLAWTKAATEAKYIEDLGIKPYFVMPAERPPCHPFSYAARARLNTAAAEEIEPWGSEFDFVNDFTE